MQPDVQDHRFQEMAQARSPLLHLRIFHFLQKVLYCIIDPKIDHVVGKQFADQKLSGDIVKLFLSLIGFFVFCHFLYQNKVLYKALFQSDQRFPFCEQVSLFLIFLLSLYISTMKLFLSVVICQRVSVCIFRCLWITL